MMYQQKFRSRNREGGGVASKSRSCFSCSSRRAKLLCCLAVFFLFTIAWLSTKRADAPTALDEIDPFQRDTDSVQQLQEKLTNRDTELEESRARNARLQQQLDDLASQPLKRDDVDVVSPNDLVAALGSPVTNAITSSPPIIAVLVLCHDRPDYLQRTLDVIFKYKPNDNFPVIVSQDGTHQGTWDLLQSEKYSDKVFSMQHANRVKPKALSSWEREAYYYIAQHYGWALTRVFDLLGYDGVIILEEDLEIAPDFFEYMLTGWRLLEEDPSLYAVSAWNDLGEKGMVNDPTLLRRSNFFPGLGWLMTRSLWKDLGPKWPSFTGYWDDWMREPAQRKGRDCIHPEISRTFTFGAVGASGGQFYTQHLSRIQLNTKFVPWRSMNLDYLKQDSWSAYISSLLNECVEISSPQAAKSHSNQKLCLYYTDLRKFTAYASNFGIQSDEKAGVPRTAFDGVVHFRQDNNVIVLAPTSKKV
eukprot:TRINITY_DN2807_c0_g1_i2.p1 TRINITY_DN2807_c0_g1~~TRINITY_DN2807_c0_g1_i2.p1  ORF type:complete len:473 (-),score=88.79 TRINITY_DN2807_c0_g1_i2:27-1445(-)